MNLKGNLDNWKQENVAMGKLNKKSVNISQDVSKLSDMIDEKQR